MTYDFLLENVHSALKRNEHKAYPAIERQLITYLLSQLREGIQGNRFRTVTSVSRDIEIVEMEFHYQNICIFTKHRYGSIVKSISHQPGYQMNMRILVGFLETLGLKCEVNKRNNRVNKMFVRVPLQAKTEVP